MMVLALLVGQLAWEVYVSPTGVDTNPGTATKPFRTIERAIAFANAKGSEPVSVHLKRGNHRVFKTIKLSSNAGFLRIVGDPGATLTGGMPLNSWHPITDPAVLRRLMPEARTHVVECDLGSIGDLGSLERRGFGVPLRTAGLELFVDGKPMTLARYPNEGQWLKTGEAKEDINFKVDDPRAKRWSDLGDIWTFGYWNYDWAESYEHVKTLDRIRWSLTLDAKPAFGISAGRRFYYLNVFEELDSPGEWFLDKLTKRLYFWPPKPISKSRIVASVLQGPMFDVSRARNVSFRGLAMEAGRDCAIRARESTNIVVDTCRISDFGTFGVAFEECTDSGIRHCDITQTGEDAIKLSGGNFRTQTPGNLFAEDNHIWHYSRWCRTYHPAVLIAGFANRISHNLIEDAPHQAVLLSGNDHVVAYNDIRRVCTETGDAGAIYMGRDTTMRGNQIRYNRFRKIGPSVSTSGNYTGVMAVYLDDCWAGTTIFGNVIEGPGTGIMIGGGRDNIVVNNVFVGTNPAIHFDSRGRGWAAKYFVPNGEWRFFETFQAANVTQPPYSTRYPELARTKLADLQNAEGNKVLNNVCVGTWINYLDGLSEKDLEYSGNVILKQATLAIALKSGSTKFAPIPIERIGPRKGQPVHSD